ncbi:MAG TPA: DUF3817 domain-containing protein [Roseiflexaceae bacterium]|nr:DUF3817 domain-containing protein [Roseiflexaceae bacterium]
MADSDERRRIERRLRIVQGVALVDLVLLVALVAASLSGNREWVRILGPLHGGNFLLLVTIALTAAADGLWSWWFPLGILVSGGPVGALVGEWLIRRRLTARTTAAPAHPAEEAL